MKRVNGWGAALAAAMPLFLFAAGSAEAKPAYGKAEQKPCAFCHVGKTSDKLLTEAGKYYEAKKTLEGFVEGGKAAEAAKKPAAAPVPAKEAAAPPAPAAETAAADKGTACDCGCTCCQEKGCGDCRHGHDAGMKPPGPEAMKGHVEEMRKTLAALRESEKGLEASAGSDPFRSAVLDHLKKLDDLQASHLDHMESMMDRMHRGKAGMHGGRGGPHACGEKRGCDCPCGGMKR